MKSNSTLVTLANGIARSYSQIFFSTDYLFAIPLLLVSFIDFSTGMAGLISVFVATSVALAINLDKETISKGLYGFNALLVGLGLGYFYDINLTLVLLAAISGFFTLLVTITLQGVLGKYYLPFLSLPFVLSMWLVLSATWQLTSADVNQNSVYLLNKMFEIGGISLVKLHGWWSSHVTSNFINGYFMSLGSIFFQFNILAGVIVAVALLAYSRVGFTLSVIGYSVAYIAYLIFGLDITQLGYSYIGFNFILSAIAIGGYFYIPSLHSYLWAILVTPVIALVTTGMVGIFKTFGLPILSLPFNIVVLFFIYTLRFRLSASGISEVLIQEGKPELNLYSYKSFAKRFPNFGWTKMKLPFFGSWMVNQAHNGEYTHKGEWAHAWDFVIVDSDGKQFRNEGLIPDDYFCYGKNVIAPAEGEVVTVDDGIDDNPIGEINITKNWGNTVVIKHADNLYSKMSHLLKGSITVREGDRVKYGTKIGEVGNSGRSAYPHLHFQLQATEYIGSKTLKYPLASYLEDNVDIKIFDYPKLYQQVQNIETDSILLNTFKLKPGQTIKWKVKEGVNSRTVKWEVFITPLNKLYIQCSETKAKAYFDVDGVFFYFTHFEGDKQTLLYRFYLAAYRIPLAYINNLSVNDWFPVNKTFGGLKLYLHDFFAPFIQFLSTKYQTRITRKGSEFDAEGYQLFSIVTGYFLRKVLWVRSFSITVKANNSLYFKDEQNEIEATCEL